MSSSQSLSLPTLHVLLLDQHLQLQIRLKVSNSAVTLSEQTIGVSHRHRQTAFNVSFSTPRDPLIQAKNDKLAAQVPEENSLLKEMITSKKLYRTDYDYYCGGCSSSRHYCTDDFRRLRPHLWPDDEADDT